MWSSKLKYEKYPGFYRSHRSDEKIKTWKRNTEVDIWKEEPVENSRWAHGTTIFNNKNYSKTINIRVRKHIP